MHGQSSVTKQGVLPADEWNAIVFSQQLRSKAGAIDKEITLYLAVSFRFERCNIAIAGCVYTAHMIEHMLYAELFRTEPLQKASEFHRIQMISVVCNRCEFRSGLLLGCSALFAQVRLITRNICKSPVSVPRLPLVCEVNLTKSLGDRERMIVVIILFICHPIDKL